MLNSQGYELLFIDVESGSQVNASSMKETEWKTTSVLFGWDVQGIWPGVDYTDVNAVDRSKNGKILATGDDFGQVKLFQYPCVNEGSEYQEHYGHSSHVTKVKFSHNDEYLFSTGGNDLTVFVWKTDWGTSSGPSGAGARAGAAADDDEIQMDSQGEYGSEGEYDQEVDPDDDDFYEPDIAGAKQERADKKQPAKAAPTQDYDSEFGDMGDEYAAADEFMAVKPWIGAIKAPTHFTKPEPNQEMKPDVSAELEWVHGYRGSCNARNNLQVTSDGGLAYFAAGVGVVLEQGTENTQKFF